MMDTEKTKEYILNGGEFFNVREIDSIRDDHTKVIITNRGNFFINKNSKKLHFDYPTTDENLIADDLVVEYTIDRLEKYIEEREQDIIRAKNVLIDIKKQ